MPSGQAFRLSASTLLCPWVAVPIFSRRGLLQEAPLSLSNLARGRRHPPGGREGDRALCPSCLGVESEREGTRESCLALGEGDPVTFPSVLPPRSTLRPLEKGASGRLPWLELGGVRRRPELSSPLTSGRVSLGVVSRSLERARGLLRASTEAQSLHCS